MAECNTILSAYTLLLIRQNEYLWSKGLIGFTSFCFAQNTFNSLWHCLWQMPQKTQQYTVDTQALAANPWHPLVVLLSKGVLQRNSFFFFRYIHIYLSHILLKGVLTLLPNDKTLDWSIFKALEGDKINLTQIFKFVFGWVENILVYQHFLLFPKCFQKVFKGC